MATQPNCNLLNMQVATVFDRREKALLDLEEIFQRGGKDPGKFWMTINGYTIKTLGPGTPELNLSDRISLKSNIIDNAPIAGQRFVGKIGAVEDMIDINSSAYQEKALRVVNSLTEPEWRNLNEVFEQRIRSGIQPGETLPPRGSTVVKPMNRIVEQAFILLNSQKGSGGLLDHLGGIVEDAGLLRFGRLDNYFPNMLSTSLVRDKGFQNTARLGMARNVARQRIAHEKDITQSKVGTITDDMITNVDKENAQLIFNRFIAPQYAVVAPNLEEQRIADLAGGIEDPKQWLPLYIKQLWRRVAEQRVFGPRDHLDDFPVEVKDLLQQIRLEGGDTVHNRALALAQDTFGIYPSDPFFNSGIARTLQSMQAFKLTLSVFRNTTQMTNQVLSADAKSFVQALEGIAKDVEIHDGIKASEFWKMIGVSADMALHESTMYAADEAGQLGKATAKMLKYTLFTPSEQGMRIVAGLQGAMYLNNEAKILAEGGIGKRAQLAEKRIRQLGFSKDELGETNFETTIQQKLLAGRRFINEVHFRSRLGDLPFFVTGAPGFWRWMLTFRTFSIKQTGFMIKEMQRNKARMVAFSLGVMPGVGFAAKYMQELAVEMLPFADPRVRDDDESTFSTMLESWANAGSLGLVSDLAWSGYLSGGTKTVANYFTPPGIGTLNNAVSIAGELGRGRGRQAMRDFLREFGGLGSAFGRYAFPSEKQAAGREDD